MSKARPNPVVLIASTHPPWRQACVERCLATGCDVHTASRGVQAIDDLRKHRYDVVVFDDSMPDISAFELHLNVRDIARNAPAALVALSEAEEKPRGGARLADSPELVVGTPEEVVSRLEPVIEIVIDRLNGRKN